MSTKPLNQEQALKAEIAKLGSGRFVIFDDKRVLAKWAETITSMERRGLCVVEVVTLDEQSTQMRIYPPKKERPA